MFHSKWQKRLSMTIVDLVFWKQQMKNLIQIWTGLTFLHGGKNGEIFFSDEVEEGFTLLGAPAYTGDSMEVFGMFFKDEDHQYGK